MKKSSTFSGDINQINQMSQAAIWKAPPGVVNSKPLVSSVSTGRLQEMKADNARLSPDSGRGSDPTGSDTSNFSDQEKVRSGGGGGGGAVTRPGYPGYTPPGWQVRSARFSSPSPESYGYSGGARCGPPPPPAYRPPPQPSSYRNNSPASDPPPYREPPPAPGSSRTHPASPSPGRQGLGGRPPPHPSQAVVRPPHYSPPPQHRERGGNKGTSPARNLSSHNTRVSASPSRGQSWLWPPRYTSQSPHQVARQQPPPVQ